MQKLYSATQYFIIGYAIISASMTSLYFLPGQVRLSLGMVLATVLFVDMSYRYFGKNSVTGESVSGKSVIYLMTYWSILSITLDVLIMVIILPMISSGELNWVFFSQQGSIYWIQFPMLYVIGFASQSIFNRVVSITTSKIEQI